MTALTDEEKGRRNDAVRAVIDRTVLEVEGGVVMLNVRVSAALRRRLKTAAAERDTTLQEVVTSACEKWLLEAER